MSDNNEKEKISKEDISQMNDEIEDVITEQVMDNDKQTIKDLEDKLLRVQAETQNYRRRKDDEVKFLIKYANEDLIEKILPTLDNFQRAMKLDDNNLTDELSKFFDGFKMIYSSLTSVLNGLGLKEIEALDKPFDPVYHQAVLTGVDNEKEDGIILEVLQKGYMLNDKVIRATMVKVNNL